MNVSNTVSCLVPRKNNSLLLCVVFSGGFLLFLVLNIDPRLHFMHNERTFTRRRFSKEYPPDNARTIRTEGCRIPLMTADDDLIRKMGKPISKMKPCEPNPLLSSNTTHIWIEKENMAHYKLNSSSNFTCCYTSFYRPTSIDDITSRSIDKRVKYNGCRNFTDTIEVNDEFVRVICGNTKKLFDSFFVFAREKKLKSKSNKELQYNILILGIDSVSRLNLHRTMPKTVAYFNKLGAVELLGYNKVGDNTFPNLIPLLLGKKDTELKETCYPNDKLTFDNCPFIWHRAQQAGFATALAEDSSSLGTFNYKRRGFVDTPVDYYFHTFIHEAQVNAATNKESNSMLCMNNKYFFKLLLDYVGDLTAVLKSKLFGFFWEITMSHDELNYPAVMDDSYSDFFKKMHASGYLNETIIFLMSDHGMRWGKFRRTKQGFLEDRLPFVIALTPPSFRNYFNKAYNNLKLNTQRLTTPFDMHATLSDLINLENIKNDKIDSRSKEFFSGNRGISLFLPIPGNRTCKSAAIDHHWCTCYKSRKMRRINRTGKKAVGYIITYLNYLLVEYPECARLAVTDVLEVRRLLSDDSFKNDSIELTVLLKTNPGGGVFEATVGLEGGSNGSWYLAGSVSRLNLYGNQSYCVSSAQLKLYCYCLNATIDAMEAASLMGNY